ncbi:YojF family protein [Neobacillus sp. LXY-4]|uniref:YojF family protein n=1 Tax=Neobacillus sp. LXY-4 TaxID=3379826 RepID=UPI003EE09F8E
MEKVIPEKVQEAINRYVNQDVYLHLETTNGAYASHHNESFFSAGAYIRNALIQYESGKIVGSGPYRVGLKLSIGWVYAEGITHFEIDDEQRLLLAGHDSQGKLAVALELSPTPFE